MLTHIAKLIWNRKWANLLIISEVAIAFAVLFGVVASGTNYYRLSSAPLGFNLENTWSIRIDTGAGGFWNNQIDAPQLKGLLDVLGEQRPEIASLNVIQMPPFDDLELESGGVFEGIGESNYKFNTVTASGPGDWGVKIIAGRWFGPQDDGQNYEGVVVNERFVDQFFGDINPVNFDLIDSEEPEEKPLRIVGVFEDFRQNGGFSPLKPYLFFRYRADAGDYPQMTEASIVITFDQTMPADYEETLMKTLKTAAPQWEFNISTWKSARADRISEVILPLVLAAIVVGFLLIMVAMGLFGILWQNISQRTAELGLRRAIGASNRSIHWQIIGELVVLALFGVAIALLFLLQIPLLQLVGWIDWTHFWLSFACTMGLLLILVICCALYPSLTATRISPALALHYE